MIKRFLNNLISIDYIGTIINPIVHLNGGQNKKGI